MARRRRSPGRARPRARGARPLVVLLAFAAAGATLSACGGARDAAPPASSAAKATNTTSSSTTTTSTTTTLPHTTAIAGSDEIWASGSFGLARRVPVVPVPDGALAAPSAPIGSPQAAAAVIIGYHQVGSGPDLLLIMGQRGSTSWWDPQLIADLAAHFRVTYFDLPGIGYSAPASGARSVETLADLTAGLSNELGLTTPIVLGWGLGGDVALALAERHPGLPSRLVLAEASAGAAGIAPSAAVRVALADPSRTLAELSRLFFTPAATAARSAWLARLNEMSADDVTASGVASSAALAASFAHDGAVFAALGRVRIPVLVVSGSADVVVPPANSALLARRLVDARRLVVPGAGYASLAQGEPRVVAAIVSFTGV